MTMAAIDYQLLANAGSPPVSFKEGDLVFATGDKGDKMYVVRSGEVEIERDGKVVETVTARGRDGSDRRSAASRDRARQDGLRSRSHRREELPLPRA